MMTETQEPATTNERLAGVEATQVALLEKRRILSRMRAASTAIFGILTTKWTICSWNRSATFVE